MQTFETTDIKVARRCRIAQYNGRDGMIDIDGESVNCIIRSVMDVPALTPTSWEITVERIAKKPDGSWKGKRTRGF